MLDQFCWHAPQGEKLEGVSSPKTVIANRPPRRANTNGVRKGGY